MESSKRVAMKALVTIMDLLDRNPRLVRMFFSPLVNAPVISSRIPVLFRAHLGATAFEIHDVDLKNGRIGIGGVEEIMTGSKMIHLLHTTLGEVMDEKDKKSTLYRMGRELCCWEVGQALEKGRWAPRALQPLIMNAGILDEVQRDPLMAKFFGLTMNMMSRLITDEGGWGHLDFDFSTIPMKVYLSNSQEARWLTGAGKPVCHFYTGIVAGYGSTISGEHLECREIECKAAGAERCTFELIRGSAH